MRLAVLAIGQLKAGPERDLAEIYATRAAQLGRQAGITEIAVRDSPESRAATAARRRAAEAQWLVSASGPKAFAIALDERGKLLSSLGVAQVLKSHLGATADLAFLIGGPDGHGEAALARAGLVLSLGPMTWPHRLVRVMLAEQIYRAVTILVNHPYHRP